MNTRNRYLIALIEALRALALTLIPTLGVGVLVWSLAGSSTGRLSDAVHGGAWVWLGMHKVLLHLSLPPGDIAGSLWFTPIGFLIIPIVILRGALRRLTTSIKNPRGAITLLALSYGLVLSGVSLVMSTHAVRPNPLSAFFSGILLTVIAALSLQIPRLRKAHSEASDVIKSALLALLILLGISVVLTLVSYAMHFRELVNLYTVLQPGLIGGLLLTIIVIATLPNAFIMGIAYLIGAGFSVGDGSLYSSLAVESVKIPALPMLAALPSHHARWQLSFLVLATFVSLIAGAISVRGSKKSINHAMLDGLLVGAILLGLVIALNMIAGGPLIGGSLSAFGASPIRLLIYGAPTLIASSILGALLFSQFQSRNSRDA